MLSILQRALALDRRELKRALPLFLYLFLATAGAVASKSARDALFLDRFGANALPYVDISIAILVGIAAGIYIRRRPAHQPAQPADRQPDVLRPVRRLACGAGRR